MKKAVRILLMAAVALVAMTSCEKDEEGFYLSSVYCTATCDGVEYVDRMKSKLPGVFLGPESPFSDLITEGPADLADSDIWPVLYIQSHLSSSAGVMHLYFYLRNIEPGENLVGREITFTSCEPFEPLLNSEVFPVMARDKVDIAVAILFGKFYSVCSGRLRIKEYDERNKCITGDFSLLADGTPITGNFYNIAMR